MNDGDRLLEAGSARERMLLRAGVSERPSDESMKTAARVLGFVPRAAAAAYLARLLVKGFKSWLKVYALAPAIAVAGATAAFYSVVVPHSHSSARATTAADPPSAVRAAEARAQPFVTALAPEAGSAPLPSGSPSAPPSRATQTHVESASHDGAADVRGQVALIDHARSLAESGDTGGALQALDGYDRAFPRGVLSEESALLRIQAFASRGDHRAVAALAKRFLAEHPRSVHAAKVRALLDGAN